MKKLNGYRPTHRNKWKLITTGVLTLPELSLLEYYADIVDFDYRHGSHGLIEVYFDEIAAIFDNSESTIRNWHKVLLTLGFIQETSKKHILKLTCFERYISPGCWKGKAAEYGEKEKDQPIEIILYSFGINFQTVKEKLQQVKKNIRENSLETDKSSSIAIGSSKVEYVSNPPTSSLPNQNDYKKIKEEENFKYLSEEDMKWIDENVHEDFNVLK